MGAIASRLGLAFGAMAAIAASQAPEFAQQYRQRLGGAVDELNRSIEVFNADAARAGASAPEAIARLKQNADPLAQNRGSAMEQTLARRDRLEKQQRDFAASGAFGRLYVLASEFDPQIARSALDIFEPAVPMTTEGWTCAGAGFLAGWGAWGVLAAPFTRRRRKTEAKA